MTRNGCRPIIDGTRATAWLMAATGACAAAPSYAAESLAQPLVACLEPIAREFHVRIVDASGRGDPVACTQAALPATLDQALQRVLQPNGLAWRRLADGTLQVVTAAAPMAVKLLPLTIDGDPVAETPRPEHASATPLIERATAQTTLDARWLDSAPLLGFNQIGLYAPNVYGSGRSIAIRGTERDQDYFPSLAITFDGVELGYRMLDDELVPLDDVSNLALARGPRTFEAAGGSQAGEIALRTAPPAPESTPSVALGVGNDGARNGEVAWSGPIVGSALGATIALDEHELPTFIRQVVNRAASVDKRRNRFGRAKLRFAPEGPLSAEFSALALSGDSSDRQVVAPPAPTHPGQPLPPPFDPFQRDSYATYPIVAQTHARGAAGYVRYDDAERWTVDAHASVTTILRDSREPPTRTHWTDHELRRREGVTVSDHPGTDWTLVAELERDHVDSAFFTPVAPAQEIYSFFGTWTDSASLWAEHAWGTTWNAGLGVRWLHERTAVAPTGDNHYSYQVPVPLATVEWRPWSAHTISLSYGTGFRSGGQENAAVAGSVYVPERTQNFEAAWRARWLDGTLDTTLRAFDAHAHDRYTYYLSSATGLPVLVSVRSRGVEFEFEDELSPRWRVRGGAGILSSHYHALVFPNNDPTSEAPPYSATLGVRYGLAQGWYGAADAYRAAAAQYYISSSPAGRLPPYDVLGLRVGYRTAHWDTALIATNAYDSEYYQRIQVSFGQFGYRLGDPRRVELRLKASW